MQGHGRTPGSAAAASAPTPPRGGRVERVVARGFVAAALLLQGIAGFKLLAPPKRFESLAPLRLAPSPALWPFLDYDMYSGTWHEGDAVDRPRLVGRARDGRRVELHHARLGLSFRELRDDWMNPLRGGDLARAHALARRWRERTGEELVEVALENEPAIVSREGVRSGGVRRERVVAVGGGSGG